MARHLRFRISGYLWQRSIIGYCPVQHPGFVAKRIREGSWRWRVVNRETGDTWTGYCLKETMDQALRDYSLPRGGVEGVDDDAPVFHYLANF